MPRLMTALATVAALALPGLANAQDMDPNVAARQSLMDLYAYNLGVLGGMAQARIDYDADLASAAATSLYHLSMAGTERMWAEGTDNMSVEGTRALPAIWDNAEDFEAHEAALVTAAEAMMEAAGTDLASLQGAMGGLGRACGACHQTYRQPE
ncbi:cytochrome c [Pararhodobacter sp. CCB-MM2]|uniref:c-type cytochrome n=1 Tax=Pararhodobacter sp. CCB-MM2 TaxID=1786003 RepID=UPI0008350FA9|nr:cytochrome c [Pararhodobacter sp. CCB-MM2]